MDGRCSGKKTSHNYAMWDFLIYNHCKLSLSWLRHISGAYIKIWNVRHAGTTNNSNVIVAWMTIVAIKSLTTIYLFVYSYPTYIGSGIVFLSSAFLFLHMLVWWQRDANICTGLKKKKIFIAINMCECDSTNGSVWWLFSRMYRKHLMPAWHIHARWMLTVKMLMVLNVH